ncbi:hypothetical protein ACAW74_25610 [Fibrella sp. WM1]|uniref:hypothetical protein n=1 Tax=Fibrella musci TaxID=3242485 RepID=UPI003522E0A2
MDNTTIKIVLSEHTGEPYLVCSGDNKNLGGTVLKRLYRLMQDDGRKLEVSGGGGTLGGTDFSFQLRLTEKQ